MPAMASAKSSVSQSEMEETNGRGGNQSSAPPFAAVTPCRREGICLSRPPPPPPSKTREANPIKPFIINKNMGKYPKTEAIAKPSEPMLWPDKSFRIEIPRRSSQSPQCPSRDRPHVPACRPCQRCAILLGYFFVLVRVLKTYKAALRPIRLEWSEGVPEPLAEDRPVEVSVTILEGDAWQSERMAEALEKRARLDAATAHGSGRPPAGGGTDARLPRAAPRAGPRRRPASAGRAARFRR